MGTNEQKGPNESGNRTPRQKQYFPVKLNDEQRYGICLRIALGWTTRQVQKWLLTLGVKISYAGLRRYWRRARWVTLTNSIRANITSRPEAQQLIREVTQKLLHTEFEAFKQMGIDLRDDLRKMSIQDPQRAEQCRNTGFFLVQRFNEALDRVSNLIKALGIAKGSI